MLDVIFLVADELLIRFNSFYSAPGRFIEKADPFLLVK